MRLPEKSAASSVLAQSALGRLAAAGALLALLWLAVLWSVALP